MISNTGNLLLQSSEENRLQCISLQHALKSINDSVGHLTVIIFDCGNYAVVLLRL